jgi:hypothetical protein
MSLRLCSFDTSTSSVWVGQRVLNPGSSGGASRGLAQVEHEGLGLQLAQHVGHVVALDDAPPSMIAMLRHRFSASSR